MGGHFWGNTAAWTFLTFVLVLSACTTADQSLLQDLGLNILPDIAKINISLDEYSRMMSVYLKLRENSLDNLDSIPKLVTFNLENKYNFKENDRTRLRYPIYQTNQDVQVESAQLRILAPPQGDNPTVLRAQIHQILGPRRRFFIEERTIYLSTNKSKWIEFDVTSAVQQWLNGEKNLGLELLCLDCIKNIVPIESAITALILPEELKQQHRIRRSIYQPERRTDCQEGKGKKKCCRHNMVVKFADLKFPEMESILEPKTYEAGFCQGQCPPNYNHATNHSRIQSLVHQMDRKIAKIAKRKAVPKACCAPSKLGTLEILRVNPMDETKLMVEKWDNMQVIECACS